MSCSSFPALRYDPESENVSSSRNSLRKPDSAMGSHASLASVGGANGVSMDADENQSTDAQVLTQQLRETREEKERISSKYDQVILFVLIK